MMFDFPLDEWGNMMLMKNANKRSEKKSHESRLSLKGSVTLTTVQTL